MKLKTYTLYTYGPRGTVTNNNFHYRHGMYVCSVIAKSIRQAYYLLANSIVASGEKKAGIYMIDCSIPCSIEKWQWPKELYPWKNDEEQHEIKNEFGKCNYSFESDYVHIFNLYIYPEYRRQGKARKMLASAINAIRNTGYNGAIQIVAMPYDDCGISAEKLSEFYKSMGLDVYSYYG